MILSLSFSILAQLPAEFVEAVPVSVDELSGYVLTAAGLGMSVYFAYRAVHMIGAALYKVIGPDEGGVSESYGDDMDYPWGGEVGEGEGFEHPSEWENSDGTTESVHGEYSSWSPDKSTDWEVSWEDKRDALREEYGYGSGPAWEEQWEAERAAHAEKFNSSWEPSESDPDHKVIVMEGYSAKPYDGPQRFDDGHDPHNFDTSSPFRI